MGDSPPITLAFLRAVGLKSSVMGREKLDIEWQKKCRRVERAAERQRRRRNGCF
jgi:hypothetical protein